MLQVQTIIAFLFFSLLINFPVFAESEDQDLDTIEAEIKNVEVKATEEVRSQSQTQEQEKNSEKEPVPEVKIETISDLSKLSEFSDVAVMQRRYMPKTGRFQMNVGLSSMVNDPWYTSVGANLRAAFGLTEQWGLEAHGFFMSTTATTAAQDLFGQHAIQASQSFGALRSYFGGHIMWTPIYGKLSLFNARIIPFDMYFTLGGGTSQLDGGQTSTAPTFSLGTGQIFALTRSTAFRWDLTINNYAVSNGSVNNLLLSFGASFYIPEASYR